jgi:leucyl/phenylalanyl-tRNA--protein transferase
MGSVPIVRFPDPRDTGPEGIVAVGGDLHPDSLRLAYRHGIFPWPHDGLPLLWFCPPERAILDFDRLHVGRRLARMGRTSRLTFTVDQAFDDVIAACRKAKRPGQPGTWITPAMERAYKRLHREGDAHSAEAWNPAGELVGGVYGVDAGGAFGGESMFHREPNASKLALLFLVAHLRARGAEFLDIQMMTPHMAALGAIEVSRNEFLARLAAAQARGLTLFDPCPPPGASALFF